MPKCIAVVDDAPSVLALVTDILAPDPRFDVVTFARHETDVDALAALDLALIIEDPVPSTDSRLPAFALLAKILHDERLASVPVLILSEPHFVATHQAELEARENVHFLAKPFGLNEFDAIVAALANGDEPPDAELPRA